MPRLLGRNYFIVKHDLASFLALPGFVWNSYAPASHPPKGFRQIEKGDRWVAFAYATSENAGRPASLVTGFYESVRKPVYGRLTAKAHRHVGRKKWAWLIRSKAHGRPLTDPVVIPPIASFLKRPIFNRNTITRIWKQEFGVIQAFSRSQRFDPAKIACLGRDPRNEQEVVAVVASVHRQLGIERILKIQTAFPDMLAKIKGRAEPIHLELELYSTSFFSHQHAQHVRAGRFRGDRKHVGILCWIDDDRHGTLKRHVHRVYELRTLLREGRTIRW